MYSSVHPCRCSRGIKASKKNRGTCKTGFTTHYRMLYTIVCNCMDTHIYAYVSAHWAADQGPLFIRPLIFLAVFKQYTLQEIVYRRWRQFQVFSTDLVVQFLFQLSCLSLQIKYEYMSDSIIMYYFCVICLSHYLWHTRMVLARLRQ